MIMDTRGMILDFSLITLLAKVNRLLDKGWEKEWEGVLSLEFQFKTNYPVFLLDFQ